MSDQSERIRAALLRFKAVPSMADGPHLQPAGPEPAAPQPVVVNEQNLAALFLPSVGRPFPEAQVRKMAASKGS